MQYVHELKEDIDIVGDRLYVFLKENFKDGKVYYEYQGSMLSTLEDKSTEFMKAFLPIATHYAVPSGETLSAEPLKLKEELDKNDRSLVFEGKEEV
jgi:hypothetical protein